MKLKTWAAAAVCAAAVAGAAEAGEAGVAFGGEAWTKATPGQRMFMLAEAQGDRTHESKVTSPALEELVREETRGATPEERLRQLGALRKAGEEAVKAGNEARKAAGKRGVSSPEPEMNSQLALALDYVTTVCGDAPTLVELRCLALVRECTSWSSTAKLVLGFLQESLDRDADFAKADIEGKLRIIQALAVDHKMMSDHERSTIESAYLCAWASERLAAGDDPAKLLEQTKSWKAKNLICFFAQSFVDGMLKRLGEHRAGRG